MPKMRSCFWFSCCCFPLIFGMRPARAFCQPQKLLAIFWVSCQLFSLSLSPSLCLVMWVLIVLFECHYVCKHSDRRRYCLLFFLVAPVVSSFLFFSFFALKCLCCLTLAAHDDEDDDDDRYDVMPQRIPLHFYADFVCVRFALICSGHI